MMHAQHQAAQVASLQHQMEVIQMKIYELQRLPPGGDSSSNNDTMTADSQSASAHEMTPSLDVE